MKTKQQTSFEVNDEVTWTSAAAGVARTKRGKIVVLFDAGEKWDQAAFTVVRVAHGAVGPPFRGRARDHESYVVLVPGRTALSKPRLYWPLVNQLSAA